MRQTLDNLQDQLDTSTSKLQEQYKKQTQLAIYMINAYHSSTTRISQDQYLSSKHNYKFTRSISIIQEELAFYKISTDHPSRIWCTTKAALFSDKNPSDETWTSPKIIFCDGPPSWGVSLPGQGPSQLWRCSGLIFGDVLGRHYACPFSGTSLGVTVNVCGSFFGKCK